MPVLAGAPHFLIAIFFAVHCVRTGQQMYWMFILFVFPYLGSLVYFLTIYLPQSRLERGARKAITAAVRMLDPQRELREATDALDEAPTVQNRMRLANAQLELGMNSEAIRNYEACLNGPFASDAALRTGLARALVESGHFSEALPHLRIVQQQDQSPAAQKEAFTLLLARAQAGSGHDEQARATFEQAMAQFGSFEVMVEYAVFALNRKDTTLAARLMESIDQRSKRWSKQTRQLNQPLLRKLKLASEQATRPTA